MNSYYEDDSDAHEGYVTEERGAEMFIEGAQQMREMLARFVTVESPTIAASIRANWVPSWGADPGKYDGDIQQSTWGK